MNTIGASISHALVQVAAGNLPSRRVLGRYLGERQAEFAAAVGCRELLLLGGGTQEATATRHRAEELGLKLREISGPHALPAVVGDDDNLLVLQDNLLPTRAAFPIDELRRGGVLTLPAGAVVEAGFERIDLTRAWSGALVIGGRHLSALLQLPEDSEAAPALLRIALQGRLPETALSQEALADGSWTLMHDGANLALLEERWLSRIVLPPADAPLSRQIVGKLLQKFGSRLAGRSRLVTGSLLAGCAIATGAVGLAGVGYGAAAFLSLVLAVFALEASFGAKRLASAPIEPAGYWHKLPWLVDIAMLGAGILAIDGHWYQRLFPPLMLLAALHLTRGKQLTWLARLRDRALLAVLIGFFGYLANVEAAIMLGTLLVAAVGLLPAARPRS